MDGTIFREMDQAGKDTILLRHNQLRQKVAKGEEENQPAAGNMRKLVSIRIFYIYFYPCPAGVE